MEIIEIPFNKNYFYESQILKPFILKFCFISQQLDNIILE